ncbi:hypothetical protein TVNIR_3475 [Thioalkalivibrio nitratireducens DSM 14787]|uniref:Nucleotidyltransferase n=1 Tax=Thioalkalivibrio nitratireducens (strain DSM 14787 / UNIQEM 213 / ALEN2) TaxID=1255043 RepID=L0E1M7_THIND|nr:hypothetical protein [Thioalkalivibrio nitratireducens]AGA35110.1 hypothetical protein TVNIR_3475 [Thioalkalivibrio nitratireducens DSM 14787]
MATPESRTRQLLAEEAARIILEEGVRDYGLAKRKAAEHLGVDARRDLPANTEVESALLERSRLFATADTRREYRDRLRAAALVMERLSEFEPRLVGPLLLGVLQPQAVINLHGFAETVEEVIIRLGDRGIACHTGERQYRGGGAGLRVPYLSFRGPDDTEIELTVFPTDGIRQAPPSPIDGRPMRRLGLAGVRELIAESEANDPASAD